MASLGNSKPLPQTASVDAEAAVLEARVIEAATTKTDHATEVDGEQQGTALSAKKPAGGFSNYIVSASFLAHLQVWDSARLLSHRVLLFDLNRLWSGKLLDKILYACVLMNPRHCH
jgi:hypothetical protein